MSKPSKLPESLYKYRSLSRRTIEDGKEVEKELEYLEAALLRGEFMFSPPSSFNDPFDCWPVISMESGKQETLAHYRQVLADDPYRDRKLDKLAFALDHPEVMARHVEEMNRTIISDITNDLGVFCLSQPNDDILMWSHYADNHRGVCLRFNKPSAWPMLSGALRVKYRDDRPVLNLIADDKRAKFETLLVKASHWKYEREWRVLVGRTQPGTGPGVRHIAVEALDAIILGARISDAHEEKVRGLVARRSVPTALLQARMDKRRYRISIEPA